MSQWNHIIHVQSGEKIVGRVCEEVVIFKNSKITEITNDAEQHIWFPLLFRIEVSHFYTGKIIYQRRKYYQ